MRELGRRLDFDLESSDRRSVCLVGRPDQLDGARPLEQHVLGPEHLAHAATSEPFHQPILTELARLERLAPRSRDDVSGIRGHQRGDQRKRNDRAHRVRSQTRGQLGNKPALNGHHQVRHEAHRDHHASSAPPGIGHEDAIDENHHAPRRRKLVANGGNRDGIAVTRRFAQPDRQHQRHLHDDRAEDHQLDASQLGKRKRPTTPENNKAAQRDDQDQPAQPPKTGHAADQIARESRSEHDDDHQSRCRQATAQQGRRFVGKVRTIPGDKTDLAT